jgi:DNA-binding transcriptional LysR family regulator
MRLDDLPAFLALARHQRLNTAAERLAVSHTTISRRVASLERSLGVRLFDKTSAGWTLTDEGLRFYDEARKVEERAEEAFAMITGPAAKPKGAVRILSTDGFGVAALSGWAGRFHAAYPDIRLELVTFSRLQALHSREYDLAITVHRPALRDVLVNKLTDYNLGLFASPTYITRAGLPVDQEDLSNHEFVWFVESLLELPELQFLHPLVQSPKIVFQASTVLGQQSAVVSGAGLGLLPRFMADGNPDLVHVLPDVVNVERSFWLIIPRESSRSGAVRSAAQFMLKAASREQRRMLGQ